MLELLGQPNVRKPVVVVAGYLHEPGRAIQHECRAQDSIGVEHELGDPHEAAEAHKTGLTTVRPSCRPGPAPVRSGTGPVSPSERVIKELFGLGG